jgi:hypothetical protein
MRIAVFDKVTPGYETALSMWSMDGSYFKNKRNSAAGHRGHETHRATEDLACSAVPTRKFEAENKIPGCDQATEDRANGLSHNG